MWDSFTRLSSGNAPARIRMGACYSIVVKTLSQLAIALVALTACQSPRTNPTPSTPLKVLVYNVHAGKDAGGVDNLQRVADIVKSSGARVKAFPRFSRNVASLFFASSSAHSRRNWSKSAA